MQTETCTFVDFPFIAFVTVRSSPRGNPVAFHFIDCGILIITPPLSNALYRSRRELHNSFNGPWCTLFP